MGAKKKRLPWHWGPSKRKLYAEKVAHLATARRAKMSYDGASGSARLRSWMSNGNSGNSEVLGGLVKLQQRSRELMRQEWRAKSAVRALVRSIVGAGIRPLPDIEDQKQAKQIKLAWSRWTAQARTSSSSTWYTTTDQAAQSMIVDGECFIRMRLRKPGDGMDIPIQWQLLESDMLDVSYDQDLGAQGRIVQGIEFGPFGRRTFYHFWKSHPGDTSTTYTSERVKVPADEVIHLWNQAEARPGQVRGIPWMHAVMVAIREVSVTEDAMRVGLQHSTMLSGTVTSPDPDVFETTLPADPLGADSAGTEMYELEPGMMLRLNPGDESKFAEVKAPAGVTEYLDSGDHGIAAGMGTTFEDMTGNLSRVNYSSARMGRSNSRAWFKMIRTNVIVPQMCQPAWGWFVRIGKLTGEVPMGYDSRDVRWIAPMEDGIDPVKDAAAASARMASGQTTLEDEIEAVGGDYYATIDRAKRVKDDLEKRGLKYDWVIPSVVEVSSDDE